MATRRRRNKRQRQRSKRQRGGQRIPVPPGANPVIFTDEAMYFNNLINHFYTTNFGRGNAYYKNKYEYLKRMLKYAAKSKELLKSKSLRNIIEFKIGEVTEYMTDNVIDDSDFSNLLEELTRRIEEMNGA
jgi:hypothetical protein